MRHVRCAVINSIPSCERWSHAGKNVYKHTRPVQSGVFISLCTCDGLSGWL